MEKLLFELIIDGLWDAGWLLHARNRSLRAARRAIPSSRGENTGCIPLLLGDSIQAHLLGFINKVGKNLSILGQNKIAIAVPKRLAAGILLIQPTVVSGDKLSGSLTLLNTPDIVTQLLLKKGLNNFGD